MADNQKIDNILSKGVVEVIDREHLLKRLQSGEKLRVKLGIDPTSPNIHIGRAVALWKLRAFQELGHSAVLIIGDFTGVVGDTSDKEAERPMLTDSEIKTNLKTYFDQAFKILDKNKTETHYNSEWLGKLGFLDVTRLASLFGLHEFESRDNIARRMKAGKRVSVHELMYPLMQGYDSVAVKADVELGGTDQKYNLLAGRTIQKEYQQEPQDILMTDLLEGTDGRKMSSSWGNVVNITDEANDMFGKIMSISDNLIKRYFVLATTLSEEEIDQILVSQQNPKEQKEILAKNIVELYHGAKASEEAKENFTSVFSRGEIPEEIPEYKISQGDTVLDVLTNSGVISSKSEAKRLIEQGGVTIEGKVIEKWNTPISSGNILKVGSRRFIKAI